MIHRYILIFLMGLLISIPVIFAGVACSDGPPDHCKYMGELCINYPEPYYKCRKYDNIMGMYRYWYEIFEGSDWVSWGNYTAMKDYYCF